MIARVDRQANNSCINADLHCHSNLSDGHLSPQELLDRAAERGVDLFAITDHDTLIAYRQPGLVVPDTVSLVTGIEMSTVWQGVSVHIVGLGVSIDGMAEAESQQEKLRWQRAGQIAQILKKKGLPGDPMVDVKAFCGDKPPGRLHFARLCVKLGLYNTTQQVFKKLLGAGKPGDVKSLWPQINEAISWINSAGGIAVLAHPLKYKMTNSKLRRLLSDFVEAGGQAMEVVGSSMEKQRILYLAGLCTEFNLMGSRGSDFHHPEQTWSDLGKLDSLPENVIPVWQYLEPITL